MNSEGDSFLPRIQSVFYAVFDARKGAKIVYQVPEGLIATSNSGGGAQSVNVSASPPGLLSSYSSNSRASSFSQPLSSGGLTGRMSRQLLPSPQHKRSTSTSTTRVLFDFDDISKYVIPPSQLCGRLVVCATKRHKIIGFPVELKGDYERNYFRYNLCFVFDRTADLSCYEPVVRKISRVLTACEEESEFLSSSQESIYGILEQLYEDLNSYSETSIPIDKFNSIELKIFPFYPNPPAVKDWSVPIALIDLRKRRRPNWDLTVVKVCEYIDGVNHVSRIADLADCDLDLTRQAISHLLYYQVIMMVDIFHFSNMYTLRKSIQWLADEAHVKAECGPYVTRPGRSTPDWPKLLYLYSRLKPGKTVIDWMHDNDVHLLGIDVRRFTSFGVIKGFLRRVHRWPILLPAPQRPPNLRHLSSSSQTTHTRGKSISSSTSASAAPSMPTPPTEWSSIPMSPEPLDSPTMSAAGTPTLPLRPRPDDAPSRPSHFPTRKSSAAEQSLEQLRSRVGFPPNTRSSSPAPHSPLLPSVSRRGSRVQHTPVLSQAHPLHGSPEQERGHIVMSPPSTPVLSLRIDTIGTPSRPRPPRSPSASGPMSAPTGDTVHAVPVMYPKELLPLLDGEHHTDELCVRFEVGWPRLEQWLVSAGKGKGDGDFGRIMVIYR